MIVEIGEVTWGRSQQPQTNPKWNAFACKGTCRGLSRNTENASFPQILPVFLSSRDWIGIQDLKDTNDTKCRWPI